MKNDARGRTIQPRWILGWKAAAYYVGLGDPKTLRRWAEEFDITPRVIHGKSYFDRHDLDRLMDPSNNEPKES